MKQNPLLEQHLKTVRSVIKNSSPAFSVINSEVGSGVDAVLGLGVCVGVVGVWVGAGVEASVLCSGIPSSGVGAELAASSGVGSSFIISAPKCGGSGKVESTRK